MALTSSREKVGQAVSISGLVVPRRHGGPDGAVLERLLQQKLVVVDTLQKHVGVAVNQTRHHRSLAEVDNFGVHGNWRGLADSADAIAANEHGDIFLQGQSPSVK